MAARGQRNAHTPFAAMFPGLLTDGIDRAASYIFRGIVADSVRCLQFLLTRGELDPTRMVAVGNDMASPRSSWTTLVMAEAPGAVVDAPSVRPVVAVLQGR